jgi:GTP-binding protein YchF
MKIAIIGLPNSGKTTVFNALTHGSAETTVFPSGHLEPNIANVKVPDQRVDALASLYNPKRVTRAEVQYVDIGGFKGSKESRGAVPTEVLHYIGTADALLHVVRAFEDTAMPHPAGSVNPERDLEAIELELILSDLLTVENRLEKLEKEIRKFSGAEKNSRVYEKDLFEKVKTHLEDEKPLREMQFSPQQEKSIRGYQFLSMKPILIVLNIGEDQIESPPIVEVSQIQSAVVSFCAKMEEELAQLDESDAEEFMQELGISEAARNRVITKSYGLLGLISFLTVGEDEVRAWTIRIGMKAPEAAGVIHSDLQRGFIRTEVIPHEDLLSAGSMAEAKKRGLVRLEGKEYIIKDGEISHFLFNV